MQKERESYSRHARQHSWDKPFCIGINLLVTTTTYTPLSLHPPEYRNTIRYGMLVVRFCEFIEQSIDDESD